MKKFLLFISILFSGITSSYAGHLIGAEITYTHVSGNTYEVTITVYRDCSGVNLSTISTSATFQSASCGQSFVQTLPYIQTNPFSQVCGGPNGPSTCNGGTSPGVEQFIYRGIVTLPPCSDWIMHWNSGNRSSAITNLINPGTAWLYVQNTLNNVIGTNNNSPHFLNRPTLYLPINQLAVYSHAAYDLDGDSLYYSFNQPLTITGPPGVPIPFSPGYSLLQPMITSAGMNLDQQTGQMCFVPNISQTSIVSTLVEEFRNGVLIGSQIREMQITALSLPSNQNPTGAVNPSACAGAGGGHISTASTDSTDENSAAMCLYDTICLNFSFYDPDPIDNINVDTNNISKALPGAIITLVGNNTPTPQLTVCWTPTALDVGFNIFTIMLQDNRCPILGTQSFTYDITVYENPNAGLDQTICGTQAAQLNASGGATYTWYDAATNMQIPVGPAFSCNPCSNPIALPSVTTDYYVLSSLTAACENTDTVKVTVLPDFVADAIGDTVLCDFLTKQLNVNILSGPTGTYTYLWNNSATLSNNTSQNPIASPLAPTFYVVEVTSPDGCVKTVDSVFIDVVPPPNVQIIPGNINICLGEPLNFNVLNVPVNTTYNYSWSPVIDLSNATIANPILTSTGFGTTTYTVTLTDTANGCSFDRSQDITAFLNNNITPILNDTSFCLGSSVNIDAGAGPIIYQWIPSGGNAQIASFNQTGSFAVIVSDGICVDTSNFIQISNPASVTLAAFNPDTLCLNDSVSSLPIGTPIGGNYNGVGIIGNSFDPAAAGIGTHQIIYTYTENILCPGSDTATVIVDSCVVTGINESSNELGILIYPNPSNGKFVIEKPNNLSKAIQLKLLNASSKLILEKVIPANLKNTTIDITNYSNGLYYLQIIVDDKVHIKQILKN